MKRYLYGWHLYFWTIHKMRTKRRGAGPAPWWICHRCGGCVRWLVDGQHRGSRPPPYLREGIFGKWKPAVYYAYDDLY